MGRNVLLAWSHRTGTSIRVVDERSAGVVASIEIAKPAKHGLNIMHAGGIAVVNIDTHGFVAIGPGPRFQASPILQIKGYFDGLTLEPGGVACIDARYWHVRVNAATGREISRTRVVPTPEQEEERKRALQGMTDQADR
jgi:hypothetical protein